MPTPDQLATHVAIYNEEAWEDYIQSDYRNDHELDIEYHISKKTRDGHAVFNLNTYICPAYATGKKITDKYDCGREGCIGGWYAMLGEDQKFLTAEERINVGHFNLPSLGKHFGITISEADQLFNALGRGAEGFPSDDFDDYGGCTTGRDLTQGALEAREAYLNDLFVNYGINTGETNE